MESTGSFESTHITTASFTLILSKIEYTFFNYIFQINYLMNYLFDNILGLFSSALLYLIISIILYGAAIIVFYKLLKREHKKLIYTIVGISSIAVIFFAIYRLFLYFSPAYYASNYYFRMLFAAFSLFNNSIIVIIFMFLAIIFNLFIAYCLFINKSTKI